MLTMDTYLLLLFISVPTTSGRNTRAVLYILSCMSLSLWTSPEAGLLSWEWQVVEGKEW